MPHENGVVIADIGNASGSNPTDRFHATCPESGTGSQSRR
ncbi:hypothetical protein HTIA_0951 [Halorhabdus tiamatea SARL4B]|uniref:Uncharacterized protein n=1 Tax=Halorhabdus tiamatea SARL4B TaxID=1033806 RepID=S6D2B7_9EURY|nr:hypothetical protein HTIA_0951 [Halorhabdus tiamatea SARL4B]